MSHIFFDVALNHRPPPRCYECGYCEMDVAGACTNEYYLSRKHHIGWLEHVIDEMTTLYESLMSDVYAYEQQVLRDKNARLKVKIICAVLVFALLFWLYETWSSLTVS